MLTTSFSLQANFSPRPDRSARHTQRLRSFCALLGALCVLWAACSVSAPARVLRLHVVANSDTAMDQRVKLLVRDAVLAAEGQALLRAHSRADARAVVLADGEAILAAANAVLRENNCAYGARLSVGVYGFPRRAYGTTLFPAGDYAALRVVLGAGQGHNWWCVLFPPLCILEAEEGQIEYDEAGRIKWKSLLQEWREGESKDETQEE